MARPRDGVDVGDHPPITPVKSVTEADVGGGDAWRLYELITRHFLATVSPDCRFLRSRTVFNVNDEIFYVSGRKMIDGGFTKVMRSAVMKDVALPDFRRGDRMALSKIAVEVGEICTASGFLYAFLHMG